MEIDPNAARGIAPRGFVVPGAGDRLLAGRYRVQQLIGRGGMAEVHLGQDTRLGRTVAIKLLRSSLANDPTFRIRFRQEAQAAARMTHPTIVRVFDAGEETIVESGGGEAQLPFIVMEFVDGKLLKDLIKDGAMSPGEAGHIATGLLTALEYSHRAGVVHRDIKPGNIMVTRNGQVKVMDFGIARAISDSSATVAQTTAILGTAQYFSPEQAKGETVDPRSDLYSSGIVLFEMLTGRPPFRGDSPVAVAYQHVSEMPETPSDINPKLTERMDAVILRAIEKDRFDRYQTAEEFRDDVEAVVAGRAPAARLPKAGPVVDLFGGAVPSADSTMRRLAFDDQSRVRTSNRPPAAWVWAGIVCVIVVVLAVALWVVGVVTGGFGANGRTVPVGLVGATSTSAESALRQQDLDPIVHRQPSPDGRYAAGLVMQTSPGSAAHVQQNSAVEIWISTGLPQVTVPNLANLTRSSSLKAITQGGLSEGPIYTKHSKDVAKGVVLSQNPAAGKSVDKGTTVTITVSDGQVDLPDLQGEHLAAAKSTLDDLELDYTTTEATGCGAASDIVLDQSAAAGPVDQQSDVILTVCGGQ